MLPRDRSSPFSLFLTVSFDSSLVRLCQHSYIFVSTCTFCLFTRVGQYSPCFAETLQTEAQYQPVALSSESAHPVHTASLALAGAEAVRLPGPLNKFATTLEPCLVLCVFSFSVHKCADIWVSQCRPSVPATAQHLLAFLPLNKNSLSFCLLHVVLHPEAGDGLVSSGNTWHLLRAPSLPRFLSGYAYDMLYF